MLVMSVLVSHFAELLNVTCFKWMPKFLNCLPNEWQFCFGDL
jgi:hypothetical protein